MIGAGGVVLLTDLEGLMTREFFHDNIYFDRAKPISGYLYRPLAAHGSIRLLQLEPGSGSSELRGTITQALLNQNERFEALSYVWGSEEKPRSIQISNGKIQITQSLYSALMRLRRPNRSRLLWIDALCINQNDLEEKVQQILMMSRIYSAAKRVLIYLGEEDGNMEGALQLFDKIAETDFKNASFAQTPVSWMQQKGLPRVNDPLWYQLLAFWQRPWFKRAWAVQEFFMAKDALFIVGDWKLPWKNLVNPVEKLVEHRILDWTTFNGATSELQKQRTTTGALALRIMTDQKSNSRRNSTLINLSRGNTERDGGGAQPLRERWATRKPDQKDLFTSLRAMPGNLKPLVPGILGGILEGAMDAVEENLQPDKLPLISVLTMYDDAEATDPRDKLFAFLGVSRDGKKEEFRPNYDESVESTLVRYAKGFVKVGDGVPMLYRAGRSWQEKELPSWVPDWTRVGSLKSQRLAFGAAVGNCYAAADSREPMIRFEGAKNELVVLGSSLDTISKMIPIPTPSSSDTSAKNIDKFLKELREFFSVSDDMILCRTSYMTGESLSDVQWRTLIGNMDARFHAAPDELGDEYRIVRETVDRLRRFDPKQNFSQLPSYFQALMSNALSYQLCKTQSGLFGLVPNGSRLGDKIYLVAGSRIPFVLQPLSALEDKYRLVGGCYVHGMMNGEAMSSGLHIWNDEYIHIR